VFDFLLFTVLAVAIVWIATRVFLRAPDHSRFDQPVIPSVGGRREPSQEIGEVHRRLDDMANELQDVPRREQAATLRRIMDEGLLGAPVKAEDLGVSAKPVDAGGVPAEWVLAAGADTGRRLLYIHGGGFYAGSPTSARMLTAALSHLCGVAVLSIDYRLLPENRRMDSVVDCRRAYRWIIENGPDGPAVADHVFVAGDSAGGNLALMLSAWARDEDERVMDGVIVFSPSTDSTLEGKSFRKNIDTDPMLGPALGPFARMPATLKALLGLLLSRVNPRNPIVSPLFGRLDNLPPTLVQASDCEMLIDDARRYVNKAISQGSPAELQTWPGMVHVFQMFSHVLPESTEALENVALFVAKQTAGGQVSNEAPAPSAQAV
jgi:acetyl esterase/lipase